MAKKSTKKSKDSPSKVALTDRKTTGDRQSEIEHRKKAVKVEVERRKGERRKGERRKGERRRQIDPTTCEREYDVEEIEFMQAIEDYKRDYCRPFPTWSEVLEVLKSMGYRKVAEPTTIPVNRADVSSTDDESDT